MTLKKKGKKKGGKIVVQTIGDKIYEFRISLDPLLIEYYGKDPLKDPLKEDPPLFESNNEIQPFINDCCALKFLKTSKNNNGIIVVEETIIPLSRLIENDKISNIDKVSRYNNVVETLDHYYFKDNKKIYYLLDDRLYYVQTNFNSQYEGPLYLDISHIELLKYKNLLEHLFVKDEKFEKDIIKFMENIGFIFRFLEVKKNKQYALQVFTKGGQPITENLYDNSYSTSVKEIEKTLYFQIFFTNKVFITEWYANLNNNLDRWVESDESKRHKTIKNYLIFWHENGDDSYHI